MTSPENFNPKIESTDSDSEVQHTETADEDEAVMSRRTFLRGLGATALGVAAAGLTEDAEAARRRSKTSPEGTSENIDDTTEYVGFSPSRHEQLYLKTQIKRLLPKSVSVQITLNRPDSSFGKDVTMQNMKMSALMDDGTEISVIGVPVFVDRGKDKTIDMLRGLIERLEEKVKN